ncbi:MAG: aldehyde ferredoxin oxidoreductase family protein [Clostridiales bacterium]|nr:aldehyde ferredoxin oxidoreductase family protein [Clostridiales bacterium]
MFGWSGCILRINTSDGTVKRTDVGDDLRREYIGGRGLATKLLYDEVGPDVDPKGPDNKLYMTLGPLTGTPLSACRMTVTTKTPRNGFLHDGNMGGFFPAELRFAGYDGLVLEGSSEKPIYIFIDDDKVSFHDASHLWGLSVTDTHIKLREELGDPSIRTIIIGPAGENEVNAAVIIGDLYHASGRGAAGRVMGSKKVKAIAVRGTKEIPIFDPDGFMEVYNDFWKELSPDDCIDIYHRPWGVAGDSLATDYIKTVGGLAVKNDQGFDEEVSSFNIGSATIRKLLVRPMSCFSCGLPSCSQLIAHGNTVLKMHTGSIIGLGSNFGITDINEIMELHKIWTELGLDVSVSPTISWAIEAYQKGLITKDDTEGIELKWGDSNIIKKLVHKLVYKEGQFGELMAEGLKALTEKYGGHDFALHVKGLDITLVPSRSMYGMGLAYAVNDQGADHCRIYPPYPPNIDAVPQHIELPFDVEKAAIRDIPDEKAKLIKWSFDSRAILNCLTTCVFLSRGKLFSDFSYFGRALTAATGVQYTHDQLMKIGEKICNLERSYNVLNGNASRKDDTLPKRYLNEPFKAGGSIGMVVPLDRMLDDYYKERNWDLASGRPTQQKLSELGLDFVVEDFKNKGVWSQ